MSDDKGAPPDRVEVHFPAPVTAGFSVTGWSMDDVQSASTPEALIAGPDEVGVRTEWDASSLDAVIEWLEAHAEYLNRLSYDMLEIQGKMGGAGAGGVAGMPAAPGTTSPLGSFDWAQRLTGKHSSLYTSTEIAVRRLSENLTEAVRALRKVKENYETAEQANAMSAADMAQIFADVARNG
ncbi:MAG TPA: hypothetical protein VFX60_01930 [Micromonospora sp.]|nr:hypothetical protein [Micromonospora sp.]